MRHMTEDEMIESLNQTTGRDASRTDYDRYSRYDAEDKNYIYEAKDRKEHYLRTMIEDKKFKANNYWGDRLGKEFIYLVHSNDNMYIFNVTELVGEGYNFGWHERLCKKTTDFGESEMELKEVGYIHLSKAVLTYKT